jgi:hypothetical protein
MSPARHGVSKACSYRCLCPPGAGLRSERSVCHVDAAGVAYLCGRLRGRAPVKKGEPPHLASSAGGAVFRGTRRHPAVSRPDFGLAAPAELTPSVPALRCRTYRAARLRPTEEPIGPGEEPHLRHARSARARSRRAPRRPPASSGRVTGDRAITRSARACDRHSGPHRVLETLHVILAQLHRTGAMPERRKSRRRCISRQYHAGRRRGSRCSPPSALKSIGTRLPSGNVVTLALCINPRSQAPVAVAAPSSRPTVGTLDRDWSCALPLRATVRRG